MNAPEKTSPNSKVELHQQVSAGTITWAEPLIMLSSCTVIGLIVQALVVFLSLRGSTYPWLEASSWWREYGTLVGVGCLIPLFYPACWVAIRFLHLGIHIGSTKGGLRPTPTAR